MSDIAIHVESLGKRYRIGKRQESYGTLRDSVAEAFTAPFKRFRRNGNGLPNGLGSSPNDTIWALRDVSFDVRRGEAIGIIGRNGAGKSTLLKVLSRITDPTEGGVDLYGRVGSLLEVGTGFHPELTGRENVYLNGSIIGMKRAEIRRRFDDIVAFAEIEKFIDTPVRHYSSGMYVRLAFAVAAHLEPEILLIDEVLAVGDASFQKKCLGKMGDVARAGRTVLFVSHNMGAISSMCQRVIWINDGKVVGDGKAREIVEEYIDSVGTLPTRNTTHSDSADAELVVERVILRKASGEATVKFGSGEDINIEIHYNSRVRLARPHFWISVYSRSGALFGANMLFDDLCPEFIEGKGTLSCTFRKIKLLPQTFTIWLGARDQGGAQNLIQPIEAAFFQITGGAEELGMSGERAGMLLTDSCPLLVPYEWRFESGEIAVPAWETGANSVALE